MSDSPVGEVDFGSRWAPRWAPHRLHRLSWDPNSGVLSLTRLEDSYSLDLGWYETLDEVSNVLEDWEHVCGSAGGFDWLRSRVANVSSERAAPDVRCVERLQSLADRRTGRGCDGGLGR